MYKMVEKCIRCEIDGRDVKLFDAIYDGRMSSICERCSIIENVPVIKKPDPSQLKESEQSVGVNQRMKRLAGVVEEKKDETFFMKDKLDELNEHPELEIPEKEKLNLIEHFHWHIMKQRRHKRLTQEQLAEALGESVVVIQMIEKGKLPEGAESLIRKIEQFFQIRLKKVTEMEKLIKQAEEEQEPVLLDKDGIELEQIPEPEYEMINEEVGESDEGEEVDEIREVDGVEIIGEEKNDKGVLVSGGQGELQREELDIKQINPNAVTIEDLRVLHRKKVESTRQERLEEQKKIEAREGLIEARKEELRLMREKESNELDNVLGGTELLGDSKNEIETKEVDEFDNELI